MKGCKWYALQCGLVAVLLSLQAASADDDLLVGAIRWDAWFAGSPWSRNLMKSEWNYRLPFFADVRPRGGIVIDGLSPEVMSREILYASASGINYFIFGLYDDRAPDGSQNKVMANFRRSIDLFTAVHDRRGMRFSIFLGIDAYANSGRIRELVAGYVVSSDFLRSRDGRPVIFLFLPTARTWIQDVGGLEAARARQLRLRADITRAAGKDPYLIVMTFNPSDGGRLVESVEFDAFTSYGNPLGPRRPEAGTGEEAYARCASASERFWAIAERTGEPFLPPVSLGWDYRPIIDEPKRSKDPEWCHSPTTEEIRNFVTDAVRAASARQTVRSIVIYAWNEYSEGGWLAPTFCDGAKRLEGVAEALGRERDLAAALRDAPLPRAAVNCSNPSSQPGAGH